MKVVLGDKSAENLWIRINVMFSIMMKNVPGELLIDRTIPFTLNCEVKSTTLARGMERKMKRTRKVLRSQ